jgi:hypothetical protein
VTAPADEDEPAASCAGCEEPLRGPYCHRCGERVVEPGDLTLRRYAGQAFEALTDVDGKLWRTARALLRPGFLTAEYLRGRRQRYVRPFTLFLLANVAFLLLDRGHNLTRSFREYLGKSYAPSVERVRMKVMPLADPGEFALAVSAYRASGVTTSSPAAQQALARYGSAFDERLAELARSMVIVLVPLVAVVNLLLHLPRRRDEPFGKHLVFATHFLAACLLILLVVLLVLKALLAAGVSHLARLGNPLLLLVVFAYCYATFRELDGPSRGKALVRALLLSGAMALLLRSYQALLFLAGFSLL